MATKTRVLAMDWTAMSKLITTLPLKELVQLIYAEAEGKARPYVLERLYSNIRKRLYDADIVLLGKGRVPDWIEAGLC